MGYEGTYEGYLFFYARRLTWDCIRQISQSGKLIMGIIRNRLPRADQWTENDETRL